MQQQFQVFHNTRVWWLKKTGFGFGKTRVGNTTWLSLPTKHIFVTVAITWDFYLCCTVARRGGRRTGRQPRTSKAGEIQRVRLQKLKCC